MKKMKMTTKLALFGLMVLAALATVSCSKSGQSSGGGQAAQGSSAPQGKKRLAAAFNDFNDTFLVYVRQAMERYINESYSDYEISFVDGRGDQATFQSALENIAIQDFDGVLINLVNPESAPAVEAIFGDDTNRLYFNRLPLNLPEGSFYYVGINEKKCGSLQAEYVSQYRPSGNAVLLLGILGNESVLQRTAGVKDYLAENNSAIQITREQTGNWQREEGLRLLETWLTAGDTIDIVFSNNDEMALGAAQALQQAGRTIGTGEGEIIVCGIDATPDGQNGIREGSLSMSVLQDPADQAKRSIDNIIAVIEGRSVPKIDYIDPVVVTIDTL